MQEAVLLFISRVTPGVYIVSFVLFWRLASPLIRYGAILFATTLLRANYLSNNSTTAPITVFSL